MSEAEHRQFSRVAFDATTTLVLDGTRLTAKLLDVSLKGALVANLAGREPKIDQPARLEMALNGSDIVIAMDTEIAHVSPKGLGLRCTSIDLDSIAHLRRLMELNTGDPRLVERELSALL